jgi:hypothetical protein
MAVIPATIQSCECVEGAQSSIYNSTVGARLVYRLGLLIGGGITAMTAGDTASVVTCDDKIEAITKNGKQVTLQGAVGAGPGLTPGGTAAYAVGASISGTTLTFSAGGVTASAAVAAGAIVHAYVTVDEL